MNKSKNNVNNANNVNVKTLYEKMNEAQAKGDTKEFKRLQKKLKTMSING